MAFIKHYTNKPTHDAVVSKNNDGLALSVVGEVALIDTDGNPLRTSINSGLQIPTGDYVSRVDTDSLTETWTYRQGGASGAITGTIVIVYTTTAKNIISSVSSTII